MKHVAVTGGSGKTGRAVVRELTKAGWTVHNLDRVSPPPDAPGSFTHIDLVELGEVIEAFTGVDEVHGGVDAVIHLAAIPGPTHAANSHTFMNNLTATYNVFTAARLANVKNLAWASSETLLGYPFRGTRPPYVPMDENYPPQGNVAYSLAKVLEEEIARQLTRRDPELTMVGLRLSNVMTEADYSSFPLEPAGRTSNLWGYIDARDAARAFRMALDLDATGLHIFNIAASDTVTNRPSADLMAEYFPDVEIRRVLEGRMSLTSTEAARRILRWSPKHSWRDPPGGA